MEIQHKAAGKHFLTIGPLGPYAVKLSASGVQQCSHGSLAETLEPPE